MKIRALAIVLFIAAACAPWLPFHTQTTVYKNGAAGSVPAGEIRRGFSLSQTVIPGTPTADANSEGLQHCFGLKFATYMRTNGGHLDVGWQQGGQDQQWRVSAADLADNSFRYFCPDAAFIVREPFHLQVTGVDGEPGRSATLWLVGDTRLGQVDTEADNIAGKALALDVTARERIAFGTMLRVNYGAFLFGWICTVLVGVFALLFGFSRGAGPTVRSEDWSATD
ncbi:hypothetical protein ACW7G0_00870 [Lysobacter sp. A286]